MPANSWPENDSYNELDPLNSLLQDLSPEELLEEESTHSVSLPFRFQGRRRKAALVLTMIWSGTIALHLISWGSLFVLGLTTIIGIHAFILVFTKPRRANEEIAGNLPYISLLVAAKNEETVISKTVRNLCNLDYPAERYEVWIIDDDSSDRTPLLLAELEQEYDNLKVLYRSPGAGGGKSGALNQVLPLTRGDIVAVFDADALVSPDLLLRVAPLFSGEKVGAVQVRKAIMQAETSLNHDAAKNFWIQGQMAEMALDTYMQQQRISGGGIGELRGNGQFVRRTALLSCGGWNEETITDDLDLTLRLHINHWDIECLSHPAVQEEGVTSAIALWHQRNRWAEGGYQRYLDYWDLILKNPMGTRKTWDLLVFMLLQYILPMAAIPDLLMAIARHRPPILSPMTALTLTLSITAMFNGLRRTSKNQEINFSTYFTFLMQTIRGTIYMFHWVVVMSTATARMSIRPKRLKWVKTVHTGTH
ncbi:glycosyltransferase [Calothrix sp. 336/3]|uniref:glycosyltransferase n=1 Tax=Calothrix sp. 336/3 TaxID=1337936 RepID=UPI0004E328E0|nr:glycosyltransferase family 2 protein [Calothrix sp. 336/3]AKG21100.1 glycosyl transferase [Calothrix sp. 336/3]